MGHEVLQAELSAANHTPLTKHCCIACTWSLFPPNGIVLRVQQLGNTSLVIFWGAGFCSQQSINLGIETRSSLRFLPT